jgi:hypothetical protein
LPRREEERIERPVVICELAREALRKSLDVVEEERVERRGVSLSV